MRQHGASKEPDGKTSGMSALLAAEVERSVQEHCTRLMEPHVEVFNATAMQLQGLWELAKGNSKKLVQMNHALRDMQEGLLKIEDFRSELDRYETNLNKQGSDMESLVERFEVQLAQVRFFTSQKDLLLLYFDDYFQRPQMNEIFARKTDELRRQYFPKWLGPLFVGVYVALYSPSVFDNSVSLGTFLAMIHVMKDISSEFAEAYDIILDLTDTFESIKALTVFFNKATDLLMWKKVNRQRREATRQARDELFKNSHDENREQGVYKTDQIKMRIDGMTFGWVDHFGNKKDILMNVTSQVDQGKLVAVVGPHGSGKKTLLSLLGHMIFPQDGQIFIPSHLRILHVTQEAYILNLSPWRNLIFGCANPNSVDPERIKMILNMLEMKTTLDLIKKDLEKQAELRAGHKPADDSEAEESEDEEETDMNKSKGDDETWHESLTYSEKVKIHLARALIMNPEVLVLQRPLHHYDDLNAGKVLEVLYTHVHERGLGLPEKGRRHRRPRSCFLSVERPEQAEKADVVWTIKERCIDSAVEKTETFREKMEKAFQRTTTEAQSRFHM